MDRRGWWAAFAAVAATTAGVAQADDAPPAVIGFSPVVSPINRESREQLETYTDDRLTVSADPNYPGEIVVYFADGTEVDRLSLFMAGDASRGLDPAAVSVLHRVPGEKQEPVRLTTVRVEADVLQLFPEALWRVDPDGNPVSRSDGHLAPGQYHLGIGAGVRDVRGRPLSPAPVFHAFTVGPYDQDGPLVMDSVPQDGETDVPGAEPARVTIRFDQGVAATSVTPSSVTVEVGDPESPFTWQRLDPAPGYPKLKSLEDGSTLPSNGHEVVWRAAGPVTAAVRVRVRLIGQYHDAAALAADRERANPQNARPLRDLSENAMLVTREIRFTLRTTAVPAGSLLPHIVVGIVCLTLVTILVARRRRGRAH